MSARRSFLIPFIALAVLFAAACADDAADGPTISAMTVTPSSLRVSETGMTDEFFTVTVTVEGFTEEIDVAATSVFFTSGSEDIEGIYGSSALAGDTITLGNIATSWFQGQPPGTYELGATVRSVEDSSGRPAESVTEVGLTSVTITE